MSFFIVATSILILSYIYIGWRIIVPLQLGPGVKKMLWALLILSIPAVPVYLVLRSNEIILPFTDTLSWIAYLSLGYFCLVFTFVFARDMVLVFIRVFKRSIQFLHGAFKSSSHSDCPSVPERRGFLIYSTNMGILGLSGALGGYGFSNTRVSPRVVRVSVGIHGLPDDLSGFRIVQITDTHISATVRKGFLEDIVKEVNSLEADIIAFTGDLADGPVKELKNDVSPLKELHSSYGSFFVTGNHEYYGQMEAWLEEVDRLGLRVLLNQHKIIDKGKGRIILAGVTDYNAGQFLKAHVSDPQKALFSAPASHLKILLAHQPRSIFASAALGFDLQISGHTHGGQFFPGQYFVRLQQPYLQGLVRHEKTWLYVSRGTGYWGPPIRIGAPSEITLITLNRVQGSRPNSNIIG
jgi:hypothetical protein